jgi:hypothetical protein
MKFTHNRVVDSSVLFKRKNGCKMKLKSLADKILKVIPSLSIATNPTSDPRFQIRLPGDTPPGPTKNLILQTTLRRGQIIPSPP